MSVLLLFKSSSVRLSLRPLLSALLLFLSSSLSLSLDGDLDLLLERFLPLSTVVGDVVWYCIVRGDVSRVN